MFTHILETTSGCGVRVFLWLAVLLERTGMRKDPLGALPWRKTNESEDAHYVWIWIRIQRMDVGSHALDHVIGNCSRSGLHLGTCAMAQQESGAPATARRTSYGV